MVTHPKKWGGSTPKKWGGIYHWEPPTLKTGGLEPPEPPHLLHPCGTHIPLRSTGTTA